MKIYCISGGFYKGRDIIQVINRLVKARSESEALSILCREISISHYGFFENFASVKPIYDKDLEIRCLGYDLIEKIRTFPKETSIVFLERYRLKFTRENLEEIVSLTRSVNRAAYLWAREELRKRYYRKNSR